MKEQSAKMKEQSAKMKLLRWTRNTWQRCTGGVTACWGPESTPHNTALIRIFLLLQESLQVETLPAAGVWEHTKPSAQAFQVVAQHIHLLAVQIYLQDPARLSGCSRYTGATSSNLTTQRAPQNLSTWPQGNSLLHAHTSPSGENRLLGENTT